MIELFKEIMPNSFAVLIVEDVESDAQLLVRLLKKAGYEIIYERVETAGQMRIALEKQTWDVIISDYSLPQFDGHAALTLLKEARLDIPFIIVSGTMGEEIAVSMMKAGAQDYLMKGDVARLVPAVERELEQARLRRNHRQADEDLRESEERYRAVVQSAKDAIISSGSAGNIISWNRGAETIFGYAENEVIGLPVSTLIPSNYHKEHFAGMARVLDGGEKHMIGKNIEMEGLRKDGSKFPLEISLSEWQIAEEWYYTAIIRDITERKQSESSIRQRVMELETLNRISFALRVASNQTEMLKIVLDEAIAFLGTFHGSIELHNTTTDRLDKTITRGWMTHVTEPQHNINEGIAGKVFTSGETYISRKFSEDPEIRAASRSQIPPGWGGICLPIRTALETLGVMLVSVPSERVLSINEIALLSILSEITGSALHRMQLHEQTARRLEHLQSLRVIDQAISNSHDQQMTLDILLTQTISQLGVDAADIFLLHPGSTLLELAATRGFHTRLLKNLSISESVAGRAIMEHRGILTLDFKENRLLEYPQFGELWKQEGFVCYSCVPLILKEEIIGVLEIYHRTAFTPDAEWLEFLEALAGQAAITIDNTQLFKNLQRSNLDLSHAYDATIEGWSRAMDLRDHETEGHTLRVTELTLKLARAMRVSQSQLTAIRHGALLHDIGKMGIPDAILLKEGKLTDEEWVIMRKHPQLAHDMLAPIAYLRDAINIPYCHHEKWDGTGYPRGLQGEQIPLSARIFTLADVWDALTSDRSYRKKWTKQKTRQYIQDQRSKQFDPQIMDIFLKAIGKG